MARPWWMNLEEWKNEQKKRKKRKLTPRQIAAIQRNAGLRTSPNELHARIAAEQAPPRSLYDDEPDEEDDLLQDAPCDEDLGLCPHGATDDEGCDEPGCSGGSNT